MNRFTRMQVEHDSVKTKCIKWMWSEESRLGLIIRVAEWGKKGVRAHN